MKKKIKTWLIHLLGGVTVSESQEHYKSICYNSAYISLTIIKGMPRRSTANLPTNGAN